MSSLWGRSGLAWAGLVVLSTVLTGCPRSVNPDTPLGERTGGGISGDWSVDLPEGFDGWTVQARGGCVLLFAWSTGMEDTSASRALRCHDPESGELRWERTIPVPSGFVYDKVHMTKTRVIYQNNQQMLGLELDSGDVAWTFDPGGRIIGETHVMADRVVTSLSHKVLVVLDTKRGHWRRGIDAPDHRLVGAMRSRSHGLVAMVVLVNDPSFDEGGSKGHLAAVKLDVDGGDEARPPFAGMEKAWELPIETNTYDIHLIGGVLVGHLARGELWGVTPDTGEVLYKAPDTGKVARFDDEEVESDLGDLDELSYVTPADMAAGQRVSPHHMVVLAPGSSILSQGHRKGIAMQVLEIHAHDPKDFDRRWGLQLPSHEFFRIQHDLDGLGATLIAGARFIYIVDARSGEVLWRRAFNKERRDWTSVATEGRGLYVVYGREVKPRLEAHAIK